MSKKLGSKGNGNKRSAYTLSDDGAYAMMERAHVDTGALNGDGKGKSHARYLDITDDKPSLPRE